MTRILCNLPLECFSPRADCAGVELVTFGPRQRMWVDGVHYPFDVDFDASVGSWEQLQAALPRGFAPDFVLLYWPDQEPLPSGLERCPAPVVGVVSDYNLTLPYVAGTWPFFDVLLCDRAGVELFQALSFADVRYFCQYTFKQPFHRLWPDVVARDVDIGFAGNLNPAVQRERAPWLERLRQLRQRGVAVDVRSGVAGPDYGRFLNRCKLGFNRSIRGEMNLRAFEVPACGAVLLLERDNLEVREFLMPGEECVLYGDDDFEVTVLELLADDARRRRIAAQGHRRIQDFALSRRLPALCELLQPCGRGRPQATAGELALGRATAMMTTWAKGETVVAACLQACELLPLDPRPHNLLALATLRWRGGDGAAAALQLWRKACALAPGYLPAAVNTVELLTAARRPDLLTAADAVLAQRLQRAPDWADVDGPAMPLGFHPRAVDRAQAMQQAVRTRDPATLARALSAAAV